MVILNNNNNSFSNTNFPIDIMMDTCWTTHEQAHDCFFIFVIVRQMIFRERDKNGK